MTSAPIIFIHYGDNDYLRYVLKTAKKFNERVILIGDESNLKHKNTGVEHYHFDELLYGEELEQFNRIYKRVGGVKFESINKSKGGKDWTKFNFQKWFVLRNFLCEKRIKSFWTFDSDTLILDDLTKYESLFDGIDYSSMNQTNQLQGKVNNVNVIDSFIQIVMECFLDVKYLKELKEGEFSANPEWGFTMMRVFEKLEKKGEFSSARLKDISNGLVFDECICFSLGMETNDELINDRTIKRVYKQGSLYFERSQQGEFHRIVTINLSWVPGYFFRKFLSPNGLFNSKMRELNFDKTLYNLIGFYWDKLRWKIYN